MINFYDFYNNTGLDKEEYSPLIDQLMCGVYMKELEPIKHIIKKSPKYAYWYARSFFQDRWHEAEPIIMKNPHWAYNYAIDVIKERWIEAEPIIKNSFWWDDYCWEFGLC
jgi:hypothetical protein